MIFELDGSTWEFKNKEDEHKVITIEFRGWNPAYYHCVMDDEGLEHTRDSNTTPEP